MVGTTRRKWPECECAAGFMIPEHTRYLRDYDEVFYLRAYGHGRTFGADELMYHSGIAERHQQDIENKIPPGSYEIAFEV